MRMRHIVVWPAPLYNIFPLYPTNGMIFGGYWKQKFVSSFSRTSVWNISRSTKIWARYDKKMYIGLQVKYPLFSTHFNETRIFSTDFRTANIKFRENPTTGERRVIPCGRTDMTKLTVAFRNIVKAHKNGALKRGLRRKVQATETINISGKLNSNDGNLILVRSQRNAANTRHRLCNVCPSVRIIRDWTSGYSLRFKEQSFTNKL
jgi:hypothetical protein